MIISFKIKNVMSEILYIFGNEKLHFNILSLPKYNWFPPTKLCLTQDNYSCDLCRVWNTSNDLTVKHLTFSPYSFLTFSYGTRLWTCAFKLSTKNMINVCIAYYNILLMFTNLVSVDQLQLNSIFTECPIRLA